MKRQTAKWVRKAETDMQAVYVFVRQRPPLRHAACFHCHESAEKYLKALLQDLDAVISPTNDLDEILDQLIPYDARLELLRRRLRSITQYARDYYEPGFRPTTRQMQAALHHAERVRAEVRSRLGLAPYPYQHGLEYTARHPAASLQ